MPVSNPSAFPPPRAPDQIISINGGENYSGSRCFLAGKGCGNNSDLSDLIIIGDNSFSQGVTAVQLTGTVAVGSQALAALIGIDSAGRSPVANTVMGFNAAQSLQYGGANVVIGANALQTAVGLPSGGNTEMVVIGANAAQFLDGTSSTQCVIIGFNAASAFSAGNNNSLGGSVVIGANALGNFTGTVTALGMVIIGQAAGQNLGSSSAGVGESVLIGQSCCSGANTMTRTVCVGDTVSTLSSTDNVALGAVISMGSSMCTLIGSRVCGLTGVNTPGNGSIVIGAGAGSADAIPANSFVVENNDNSTLNAMFYGDMHTGNLIVGNSQVAARDIVALAANGALNILKLVDGTNATLNPTGGGYLYSHLGALHWMGTSGTDTIVAPA